MDGRKGQRMPLDVPYVRQTQSATCGPACLMMVLKYWDPSFVLSPRVEYRLWWKSFSLVFFGGTLPGGLTAAAHAYGFRSEICRKTPWASCYPKATRLVGLLDDWTLARARRQRIPITYGRENDTVAREALNQGIPPIVMVNLKPLIGENVFHWIVLTGLDDDTAYINDPYVPAGSPSKMKKNHPVPLDLFGQAMATDAYRHLRLPPTIVLVHK